MRVVLFTKLLTLGRFVDLLLELAGRGPEVVVATPARERRRPVPEELVAAPGVRLERYEEFEDEEFGRGADLLRRTRDYVWYLRPEHRVATFNRKRALDRLLEAASGKRADPRWPD